MRMEVLNHISVWITTCGDADAGWFGVRLRKEGESRVGGKSKAGRKVAGERKVTVIGNRVEIGYHENTYHIRYHTLS
jgi:hypothetical protein